MTSRAPNILRRRPLRWAAACLIASAVAAGPLATPAGAQEVRPVRPPQLPTARLQLSITPENTFTADAPTGPRTVTLTCTPDGGTHPAPREACGSLRRVRGVFERLPDVPDVFCTGLYAPVTVRATGVWSDTPSGPARVVDYSETFSNACMAAVGTDNVFRF